MNFEELKEALHPNDFICYEHPAKLKLNVMLNPDAIVRIIDDQLGIHNGLGNLDMKKITEFHGEVKFHGPCSMMGYAPVWIDGHSYTWADIAIRLNTILDLQTQVSELEETIKKLTSVMQQPINNSIVSGGFIGPMEYRPTLPDDTIEKILDVMIKKGYVFKKEDSK